jgi:hypothetical protein
MSTDQLIQTTTTDQDWAAGTSKGLEISTGELSLVKLPVLHLPIPGVGATIPFDSRLKTTDNVDVEVSVRINSYHTNYAYHIHNGASTTTSTWVLYFFGNYQGNGNEGQIGFYGNAGGNWKGLSGQVKLQIGVWYRFRWNYQSGIGGQLWVNDVPIGVRAGSGLLSNNNTEALTVTPGYVDVGDFLIKHNDVVVGHWPMSEGSGDISYDQGPYGNHAALSQHSWLASNYLNAISREYGERVANALAVSQLGLYSSSLISWVDDTVGGGVLVEASWDGGLVWLTCTNDAPLPRPDDKVQLTPQGLLLKQRLTTQDGSQTPKLSSMRVMIEGATALFRMWDGTSWKTVRGLIKDPSSNSLIDVSL